MDKDLKKLKNFMIALVDGATGVDTDEEYHGYWHHAPAWAMDLIYKLEESNVEEGKLYIINEIPWDTWRDSEVLRPWKIWRTEEAPLFTIDSISIRDVTDIINHDGRMFCDWPDGKCEHRDYVMRQGQCSSTPVCNYGDHCGRTDEVEPCCECKEESGLNWISDSLRDCNHVALFCMLRTDNTKCTVERCEHPYYDHKRQKLSWFVDELTPGQRSLLIDILEDFDG